MDIGNIGKFIIIIGISMVIVGGILIVGSKFGIGRLPGDIVIRRSNFTFYFPLMTSIILSLLLSLIFRILRR